jgi:hypothetical protein
MEILRKIGREKGKPKWARVPRDGAMLSPLGFYGGN